MPRKNAQFRSRLFFSYSALIALSVGVFLAALAMTIIRTGESEARAQQKELALASIRQLEAPLRELDTLAAQTMTNAQLISYFVPLLDDPSEDNYFDDNLLEFIDASSLLATLNGANSRAARVSAYNQHGDYVSAGTLYETRERIERTLADKQAIQAQLSALSENPDRRLILAPGPDKFSSSETNRLIQILRPLSNAYVSEVYGIVSVQQDVSALERLGLFYDSENGACLLITDAGEPITSVTGPLGQAALFGASQLGAPEVGEVLSGDIKTDQGSLFISVARMDLSGWLLVVAQPIARLISAYRGALTLLVAAGLLLTLVLLVAVFLLADRITRPLSSLSRSIERVTLTDMALAEPLPAHAPAEVLALDNAFRTMLGRLNNSVGMEMRAYLFALQSQMHPHFLYNVLSVICASGEEEGAPKTVDMCLKLSDMLRYVADYERADAVPLTSEIDYLRRYLELMKVRYEDKFHYTIDVEPDAERIKLPKLSLQPLAENCFKHGFNTVRPPWTIHVTARLEGDRFMITVADNGSGMSDEAIQRINERIKNSMGDLAGNYQHLSIGGMGLVNTVIRLQLLMGESVTYAILSSPGSGTTVQIGGECA